MIPPTLRARRVNGGATCAGLLLTGGSSRRMGTDKATLDVGGERLVDRAVRVLCAVCDPVLEVGPGVSGLRVVREDPPGAGPLAALVAGAAALQVEHVLLLAVDLPFVSAPLLALIADWPGDGAVVPVVGGRPQHVCARYGPESLVEAAARYSAGERSLRWVCGLPGTVELDEVAMRAVASERSFADLDSPEDLDRWGLRSSSCGGTVGDSQPT